MANNYTRQSTITDGDTIAASLFNNEYNELVSAFSYSNLMLLLQAIDMMVLQVKVVIFLK